MEFLKMQGTGNDFIMLDNRNAVLSPEYYAGFAAQFCPRRTSVGADGVIFLEPPHESAADFRMRYFNSDGSEAEMCGNGARCVTLFANLVGAAGRKSVFETGAGLITGEVLEWIPDGSNSGLAEVKILMVAPGRYSRRSGVDLPGGAAELHCINTGVPHAVEFIDDPGTVDVRERGAAIRYHDIFAPAGTNANFASRTSPSALELRTYERGVEDETLACGTGATAAALAAHIVFGDASPVTVDVCSGEQLAVFFEPAVGERDSAAAGDKNAFPGFETVYLQGPVREVFAGRLEYQPENP